MAVNKKAEVIENYLLYGIDLYHRRIYFGDSECVDGDDFNFSSVTYAIRGIDKLLDINNKPIELHMSSYGGDAYAMLALYDKILNSPCKFIFYGSGFIMSAATWIMAGCDERYLSPNTTIMVHDGYNDASGRSTEIKISSDENERLNDVLADIYAKNSYMDFSFWRKVCERDLYLTAEETVKLGLADKILPCPGRGNFRKGVRGRTFSKAINKTTMRQFITKLLKRVKLDPSKSLVIEIPEEIDEEVESYDNTEKEMQNLNLQTSEIKEPLDGEKENE